MKQKKLVLIDGNAIIHRAFHAVPEDLSTSSGEPVNATFGFTSMLMKALLEEKPDYVAVTFDRAAPTFRHAQYVQYKAHRPALPDNMKPQFARIREVVQAFGIQIYEKDGYEADDILGTLSVQATQQGLSTVIYTGDMDTLQLVNEHVLIKVAKRGITEVTEYDAAEVETRYGIPASKLPDFKGLVGDKSDNIPGVPGIGEKTATRLINEYGDLEGILSHAGQLKAKEQKLLLEYADQARQSKFLATIVCDAPVQLNVEACRLLHVDTERVITLFRQLEFRSLIERALALFRQLGLTSAPGVDGATEHTVESASSETLQVAGGEPPEQSGQPEPPEPSSTAGLENLLFAPPIGAVPIITPPPPADWDDVAMPARVSASKTDEVTERVTAPAVETPPAV
ncbi:MAG: hypothetical protein IMW89_20830, partial [Ktedonobacteraceae bacterium]|nr:hypothetical protein [Ktedonobacteraceae bacterium]